MKKQYTRKQIQEAISYWKKQLAKGDYRKANETAPTLYEGDEERELQADLERI